MLKRLICRLIGHASDWQAEQSGYCSCLRCGFWSSAWPDREFRTDDGFWLFWFQLKAGAGFRGRRLRNWWRCPDCKGRFGRHDPDNCLPF